MSHMATYADKAPQLTLKQHRFVDAYLASGNAAQAARQAGYCQKAARQAGHRLCKTPTVQAELIRRRAALAARHELTTDDLVRQLLSAYRRAESVTEEVLVIRELAKLLGLYPAPGVGRG